MAILELRLQKLTAFGINEIEDELKKLAIAINGYEKLLKSKKELFNVIIDEENVLKFTSKNDLKKIRGGKVSMIFQEPMASFAPAIKIGHQMVEQLILYFQKIGRASCRERV